MPRKFWWPGSMAEQLVLVQNFLAKIGLVGPTIPLTPAQVTAVQLLCNTFIEAVSGTQQSKSTMQAMTQWRDYVLYDEHVGKTAPDPPAFATVAIPDGATIGVVSQFMAFRDLIVASPGYTEAMGEDLGLIGPETTEKDASEVSPVIKSVSFSGLQVTVTGSMQGFDAMRVEYAPKGGSWKTAAFLTNTPGSFQINLANPNQPEAGHIRAIYIKKNEDYGQYSADYPVMLA